MNPLTLIRELIKTKTEEVPDEVYGRVVRECMNDILDVPFTMLSGLQEMKMVFAALPAS